MSQTGKSDMDIKKPELLSPAGDWAMLTAALEAGADSIYFGVKELNMRATARNFQLKDIRRVADTCHERNKLAYLTLNTIIYEEELGKLKAILKESAKEGIDGIICWDHSVISMARDEGLPVHISTQASISNSMAARFYSSLGANRCVLARECTLEQIRRIKEAVSIEIEVFIHGAMCVSVSGRCFMSEYLYGRSANRGDCIQPCRREYDTYLIKDRQTGKELLLGSNYVLSPKDLCTLPFLDRIYPIADAMKIEGRARNPEYVYIVTSVYREALDRIASGSFNEDFVTRGLEELKKVYNRGFSNGFYLGKPIDSFTEKPNSMATRRKAILGRVTNYFRKVRVAEIEITANNVKCGEEIVITGPTTGVLIETVKTMEKEGKRIDSAAKGDLVGIRVSKRVRKNDSVYVWQKN